MTEILSDRRRGPAELSGRSARRSVVPAEGRPEGTSGADGERARQQVAVRAVDLDHVEARGPHVRAHLERR